MGKNEENKDLDQDLDDNQENPNDDFHNNEDLNNVRDNDLGNDGLQDIDNNLNGPEEPNQNQENTEKDNEEKSKDDDKDKDSKDDKDESSTKDKFKEGLESFRDSTGRSLNFHNKGSEGDEDLGEDLQGTAGKIQRDFIGDYDTFKNKMKDAKKKDEEDEAQEEPDNKEDSDEKDDDKEEEREKSEEKNEEEGFEDLDDGFGGNKKKDEKDDEEEKEEQDPNKDDDGKDDKNDKDDDGKDDDKSGEAGDSGDGEASTPKMPKVTPGSIALGVVKGIAEGGGGSPEEKLLGVATACLCCLGCLLFPIIIILLPILALFYWLVPGSTNNMAGIETTESADADYEELELTGNNPLFREDLTYNYDLGQKDEALDDDEVFSNEGLTFTVDEQYLEMAKVLYDQTDVASQDDAKEWGELIGKEDYHSYLEGNEKSKKDLKGVVFENKYNSWELNNIIKPIDVAYKDHLKRKKEDPNFEMPPWEFYLSPKTYKKVYDDADLSNDMERPELLGKDGITIEAPKEERDTTVKFSDGTWSGRLSDGKVLEDTRTPGFYHPGDLDIGLPFDPKEYRNGNLGNPNIPAPLAGERYFNKTIASGVTIFNEDSKMEVDENTKWSVSPKLGVAYTPSDNEGRPLLPYGTRLYVPTYGYAIVTGADESLPVEKIALFLPKGRSFDAKNVGKISLLRQFPWEADPAWEYKYKGSEMEFSEEDLQKIREEKLRKGDGNLKEFPMDVILDEIDDNDFDLETNVDHGIESGVDLDKDKYYYVVEQKEVLEVPHSKDDKYMPSTDPEDYNFNPHAPQFNHIRTVNEILNMTGQTMLETQIAYLLAAFSVSRGNSSPLGGHVNELKDVLDKSKDSEYAEALNMNMRLKKEGRFRFVWTKSQYYKKVAVPAPEPPTPEPSEDGKDEENKDDETDALNDEDSKDEEKDDDNKELDKNEDEEVDKDKDENKDNEDEDGDYDKDLGVIFEDVLVTDYGWKPYRYDEYYISTDVNPYDEKKILKSFFLSKDVRDEHEVLSIRYKQGDNKVYDPNTGSFVSEDKLENNDDNKDGEDDSIDSHGEGLANLVGGSRHEELTPTEAKELAQKYMGYFNMQNKDDAILIKKIKEYQKEVNFGKGYIDYGAGEGEPLDRSKKKNEMEENKGNLKLDLNDFLLADPNTGKNNAYIVTLTQLERAFDDMSKEEQAKYGYTKDDTGVSKDEARDNFLLEHILLSDYRDWLLVYLYNCEDGCTNPNRVTIKDKRFWGKVKDKLSEIVFDEDHEFSYGHQTSCPYCGQKFEPRKMKFRHWVVSGILKLGKDEEEKEEIDSIFRLPRQEHKLSPDLDYYEEIVMDDSGDFNSKGDTPHNLATKIEFFAQNSLETIEIAKRLEEFGIVAQDPFGGVGFGGDGTGIIEIAFNYLEEFERNTMSVNRNNPDIGRGRAYFNKRFYGSVNDLPWCAMFVSVCAEDAGLGPEVITQSAAVVGHQSVAAKEKRWKPSGSGYVPKPGDLIVYTFGNRRRYNHIGLVYDTRGGNVLTIEGNTSVKKMGSNGVIERNGDSIGLKDRPMTYSDIEGYIAVDYPEGVGGFTGEANIPKHQDFKSYMDYRTLTLQGSVQVKLQKQASTDANGFRKWKGRYMVALGSYWAKPGDLVTITLQNGQVIKAVVGDQKADAHTDAKNQFHVKDGSFVEFIVDTPRLAGMITTMGNCSYATHADWNSPCVKIVNETRSR